MGQGGLHAPERSSEVPVEQRVGHAIRHAGDDVIVIMWRRHVRAISVTASPDQGEDGEPAREISDRGLLALGVEDGQAPACKLTQNGPVQAPRNSLLAGFWDRCSCPLPVLDMSGFASSFMSSARVLSTWRPAGLRDRPERAISPAPEGWLIARSAIFGSAGRACATRSAQSKATTSG